MRSVKHLEIYSDKQKQIKKMRCEKIETAVLIKTI